MTIRRRSFIGVFVALMLVTITGGIVVYSRYINSQTVTVSFKNSRGVALYTLPEVSERGDRELVSKVMRSGESFRISKHGDYVVTYEGVVGYASGEISFTMLEGKKTLVVNPYFSEPRLRALLKENLEEAQQALLDKYKYIDLYQIQEGRLYHWGDWYGTTLEYTGSDALNSDTLRAILHKEGGVWKVATDPPDISLSKFIYLDVPEDILRSVNNIPE